MTDKKKMRLVQVELAEARRKREEVDEEMQRLLFKINTIDKYEEALAIMNGLHNVGKKLTTEELVYASPVLTMYMNRIRSLVGDDKIASHPEFVALAKMLQAAANAVNQAESEYNRQERLTKRRKLASVPPLEMEAPLCERCKKRPRKFDNLCGRCAEETGVRTHGKV